MIPILLGGYLGGAVLVFIFLLAYAEKSSNSSIDLDEDGMAICFLWPLLLAFLLLIAVAYIPYRAFCYIIEKYNL